MQRSRRRVLAGLVAASGLVVAACGNSGDDDRTTSSATTAPAVATTTAADAADGTFVPLPGVPGVTDDEIRFAAFGTQANNPLGTCVLDCYVEGIEAYFAFRNSEGGVHSRQLVLSTVLDDELANNQQRALEILSADDTFAAFSAPQVASGWADMAEARVPLYSWGIHPVEATGRDSIFSYTGVLCTRCTRRQIAYAGTLVGATKVAALGYGIAQSSKECADAAADTVELYAAETGQAIAYTNNDMAFGLPNGVGPEVTAMKKAGVDFVVGCLDPNGMKTIAQEMERQGMGDVPMYHPNTYDAAFVREADDLFEGDMVSVAFRPFEADPGDSRLEDFRHWMDETGSEFSELAMLGWLNADLAYQGLVDAGPNFDRERVIEVTNAMTDYTAGGLVAPVDFTRQHEPPTEDDPATHGPAQECTALVQIRGGQFELMSDPAKPFVCWDGTTRDWAEPVETNFS
jgi:ABC-type branched-subunit amino acid transport system substrate-binding protein